MKFKVLFPVAAMAFALSLSTGADASAKHSKQAKHHVKHVEKVVVKGSTAGEDFQTCVRYCGMINPTRDMTPVQAQVISNAAQEHCKCVKDAYQNHSTDGSTLRATLADCAHKYQAAVNGEGKAVITVEGQDGAVVNINATESDTDVLGRKAAVTDGDNADAFQNAEGKGFEHAR